MIINPHNPILPMKVIRVDNKKRDSSTRGYLTKPPEQTHTKEEMRSLVNAIHYTHAKFPSGKV